ncbi:MAG TPA: class I SAM-dependent methyltransferase [Terriglobales bacterium]|nr:class I SAM-dependent methyltransferase [Terriglobales bacterium]
MASSAKPALHFTSQDIRAHYDDFSWVYRFYWGEHIHHGLFSTGEETAAEAQELLLRYCAQLAGIAPGMYVADVGCGHGGTACFLARDYGCRVLGLTLSQAQFQVANARVGLLPHRGMVRIKHRDAEEYAFPSAAFDVMWNMESWEHFFHKAAYLRKAANALKPSGRLMIAAWTGSMRDEIVREIARAFLCPDLLSTEDCVTYIQESGLRVLHSKEIGPTVARTWDLCAEQVKRAQFLLSLLPRKFRAFAEGVDLMREGFHSGKLNYSVLVAQK